MRILSVLLIAAFTLPANAETALEVKSWCEPIAHGKRLSNGSIISDNTREQGFCWGAFAAIQGLSRLYKSKDLDTPILHFCPPEKSTRGQFIAVFVRHVEEHPELGHEEFSWTAVNALVKAFPCSKS